MKYHLITIALILMAGACVVLFGLGLVGAIFLVFAVLLEGACWVRAWRQARSTHTHAH